MGRIDLTPVKNRKGPVSKTQGFLYTAASIKLKQRFFIVMENHATKSKGIVSVI
jgi:hypothetical protein